MRNSLIIFHSAFESLFDWNMYSFVENHVKSKYIGGCFNVNCWFHFLGLETLLRKIESSSIKPSNGRVSFESVLQRDIPRSRRERFEDYGDYPSTLRNSRSMSRPARRSVSQAGVRRAPGSPTSKRVSGVDVSRVTEVCGRCHSHHHRYVPRYLYYTIF